MAPVEKAEFLETVQELRFLIQGSADEHDALADKFGKFVDESRSFMSDEMAQKKEELVAQISDTMREAGAEAAAHKAEIDEKIKDKVKKQEEANKDQKASVGTLEAEITELYSDKDEEIASLLENLANVQQTVERIATRGSPAYDCRNSQSWVLRRWRTRITEFGLWTWTSNWEHIGLTSTHCSRK